MQIVDQHKILQLIIHLHRTVVRHCGFSESQSWLYQ